MNRVLALCGGLLPLHLALRRVRPAGPAVEAVGNGPRVGIVFDVGGRGDQSFNAAAVSAAERAEKELGARVRFVEPGDGSDREAGLRLLAAEKMDLVIGV